MGVVKVWWRWWWGQSEGVGRAERWVKGARTATNGAAAECGGAGCCNEGQTHDGAPDLRRARRRWGWVLAFGSTSDNGNEYKASLKCTGPAPHFKLALHK